MKATRIIVLLLLTSFVWMGKSCQHTDTVILPEGPAAAQLGAEKDRQIAGLVAQVKAEQEAREMERAQAALVAANLEGILFAAEHVPTGLPRDAIEEEAKLGKERSPPADPTELLKTKDRVIATLNGEVEKAKALYDAASTEASRAKEAISLKDKEIEKRDKDLLARATEIESLIKAAQIEREKHANDIKDALAKKDKELADYKAEQTSKERRFFVNGVRIAGLGLIVAGAIALAVFKLAGVGGGLIGAGVLVGLISIGIETLTTAPWWPYLCGGVFLVVVGLGCYGVYRLWIKHNLSDKKTQAIQDLIDEATVKGDSKTVDELKAHLRYRLGDKTSFFGKEQTKEVVALGLVDPKGEESLKKVDNVIDKAEKSA